MHIIPFIVFAIILLCSGLMISKEKVPPPPKPVPTDDQLIAAMVNGNYNAALLFFGNGIQTLKVIVTEESRANHTAYESGIRILRGRVIESIYEEWDGVFVRWAEKRSLVDDVATNEFYYCFVDAGTQHIESINELDFDSLGEMAVAPIRMSHDKAYLQKRREVNQYLAYMKEQEALLAAM